MTFSAAADDFPQYVSMFVKVVVFVQSLKPNIIISEGTNIFKDFIYFIFCCVGELVYYIRRFQLSFQKWYLHEKSMLC